MPIYEYRCSACGFEKEYLQKLADAPIEVCERCGQSTMSKLLSAAGFQLKGSGWYVTDFKNAGAKPKAGNGDQKEVEKKGGETQDTDKKDVDKKDADKKESAAKTAASAAAASSDSPAPKSGAGTSSAAQ